MSEDSTPVISTQYTIKQPEAGMKKTTQWMGLVLLRNEHCMHTSYKLGYDTIIRSTYLKPTMLHITHIEPSPQKYKFFGDSKN